MTGRRIGSGSLDKTVWWWDAATGRPIGEPLRVDDDDVRELQPVGGDRLVSFGSVNTVRLWDARTRAPIGEPLRLGLYDPLRRVTFDEQGHKIAAGTRPAQLGCGTPPPCSRSANPSRRRAWSRRSASAAMAGWRPPARGRVGP